MIGKRNAAGAGHPDGVIDSPAPEGSSPAHATATVHDLADARRARAAQRAAEAARQHLAAAGIDVRWVLRRWQHEGRFDPFGGAA